MFKNKYRSYNSSLQWMFTIFSQGVPTMSVLANGYLNVADRKLQAENVPWNFIQILPIHCWKLAFPCCNFSVRFLAACQNTDWARALSWPTRNTKAPSNAYTENTWELLTGQGMSDSQAFPRPPPNPASGPQLSTTLLGYAEWQKSMVQPGAISLISINDLY